MPAPPRAARRRQWLEQVDAALRAQGLDAAARLAGQALAEGVEHPSLLNLAASSHYSAGRFEEAVRLLKRARSLAPKDANILNSLGVCLKALGQSDAALQCYAAAIRAEPALAAAHSNRGALLEERNDIAGARRAYQRAAELAPKDVNALASLAWLDARAGQTQSARAFAERAAVLSPGNVLARIALASADLQEGDLQAADGRLSALVQDPSLPPVSRTIVLGLIGDLADARNRTDEAFAAYRASNAQLRALNAARFERPGQSALDHVRRIAEWFAATDPEPWREAPVARPRAADPKTHVFLVGFPRSGTTLLENVLAAHPEVVSLEEKPTLAAAEAAFLTSSDGLEKLARISPNEVARHREAYWSTVRGFGVEPRGRLFIDKMPLSSVLLPAVAKLFPSARILFAVRDPRDVVLSCFRRRFALNPSMYQLLSLEGAAAYYDSVMRLSQLYRDLLPLPWHVVRYESLVEDFEGTARSACNFLGMDWDPAMTDFAERARSREISTPSAAQVARGLNREGQGAWRRYQSHMVPVMTLLDPWVRRFGYEQ